MTRIPERQCLGCREMKPKKELVRIVRAPTGEVSADPTLKLPGRGAYCCGNPACLAKIKKSKAFERALKCQIPAQVYEALEKFLEI